MIVSSQTLSWFLPDPASAHALSQRLAHRLADSLDELVTACMAAAALDGDAITKHARAIRTASTVPPGVWLHYAGALEAVRRDDPDALVVALLRLAAVDFKLGTGRPELP